MIKIQLQPEYVVSIFGFMITNTFLTSIAVSLFLIIFGVVFYQHANNHKSIIINGLRILVLELLRFIDVITRSRSLSKKVLPLIATLFIFIVTTNLLALIPGFLGSFYIKIASGEVPVLRSPNSDLTTTLALALFSVLSIQFFSVRVLGVKDFIGRFFNVANPVKFILGFFETISEGVKVISFSFRLFGNIFAGEVLLLVTAFLVPYVIPLPFMILEVFVGIIQAFIFAALTLTFIKTSTLRQIASRTQN